MHKLGRGGTHVGVGGGVFDPNTGIQRELGSGGDEKMIRGWANVVVFYVDIEDHNCSSHYHLVAIQYRKNESVRIFKLNSISLYCWSYVLYQLIDLETSGVVSGSS